MEHNPLRARFPFIVVQHIYSAAAAIKNNYSSQSDSIHRMEIVNLPNCGRSMLNGDRALADRPPLKAVQLQHRVLYPDTLFGTVYSP